MVSHDNSFILSLIFLLSLCAWYILCFYYIHICDGWEFLILIVIPSLVIFINSISLNNITRATLEETLRYNFISVGLIAAISVITLVYQKRILTCEITFALTLCIAFSVFALLHVFVTEKYVDIFIQVRSLLQLFSIVLLVYVFYVIWKGLCVDLKNNFISKDSLIHADTYNDNTVLIASTLGIASNIN